MAVLPIISIGHPILRRPARRVTSDELASPEIQQFIDDMIDTMRDAAGAGIAANQVGRALQIAVIEVIENRRYPYKPPFPLTVIVNPSLSALDATTLVINEGCLSVPLRGYLTRQASVHVSAVDRDGKPQSLEVGGLSAGTFQHEVDHLGGTLIVDRIDPATMSTWDEFSQRQQPGFASRVSKNPGEQ